MSCRDMGADLVFAWPTAEIAVMGAEGAGKDSIPGRKSRRRKQPQKREAEMVSRTTADKFASPPYSSRPFGDDHRRD